MLDTGRNTLPRRAGSSRLSPHRHFDWAGKKTDEGSRHPSAHLRAQHTTVIACLFWGPHSGWVLHLDLDIVERRVVYMYSLPKSRTTKSRAQRNLALCVQRWLLRHRACGHMNPSCELISCRRIPEGLRSMWCRHSGIGWPGRASLQQCRQGPLGSRACHA